MKIYNDCMPCLMRQTLEAARLAGATPDAEDLIMDYTLKLLSNHREYRCVPQVCRFFHQKIKDCTNVADPYAEIKKTDIAQAEKWYPYFKELIEKKEDGTYWALKIAALGNVLDSGIYIKSVNIETIVQSELEKEFAVCDYGLFTEKLKTAKRLLIIADNAGETVFDRLLAEHLSGLDILYAVRGLPIINDATVEDAVLSGLDGCTKIISTGCAAPGVILEDCTEEFLNALDTADIVISKGQGNFESLSDEGKPIFFLLKAKCNVVADRLGVDLNDYAFKYCSAV